MKTADKPKKPYRDFPLTAHRNGQWCKKIRGKIHYFGTNVEEALQKYLDERDDLQAGRQPVRNDNTLRLAKVVDEFLKNAFQRVEFGRLSPLTFKDYLNVGKLMVKFFGENSDPVAIRTTQFNDFWRHLEKAYASCRVTKSVIIVRMIFKWAVESELIERPPKFGAEFKAAARRKAREGRQGKMLPAAHLRQMLGKADPQQRAMILLGLNAGLGNNDIAELTPSCLQDGWLVLPRPKTGVNRRVPLWPETLEALQAFHWGTQRVFETKDGIALITTKPTGERVCRITVGFRKLLGDLYQKGMGFYVLRHVFQTIGDGARDPRATSAIMGHVDSSIAGSDREYISDERLLAVTNHVRKWLYESRTRRQPRRKPASPSVVKIGG